jgi:hypothetical protein
MPNPRIVWRSGRHGGHYGKVNGKLELVSVQHSVNRSDPAWTVNTPLPISTPADLRGSDDLEEAKDMAEELVRRFLRTMGFTTVQLLAWSAQEAERR